MNAKVEQYIAQQRAQISEEKQKQKQALMETLGIYDEEKEYTDEVFSNLTLAARMGYTSENVDGKIRFFKLNKRYPQLTDEEYEALLAVQKEREALNPKQESRQAATPVAAPVPAVAQPTEYRIDAPVTEAGSFGGKLMKVLAAVVWLGGLIVAIVLGRLPDRWGEMVFNFWLFLAYAAGFFVVGASYFAIGELFDNVASMNSKLHGLVYSKIQATK